MYMLHEGTRCVSFGPFRSNKLLQPRGPLDPRLPFSAPPHNAAESEWLPEAGESGVRPLEGCGAHPPFRPSPC